MWILWAIYAIVMIALVVAMYLLTPDATKQQKQTQKPGQIEAPQTELGVKIRVIFGTVRILDPQVTDFWGVEVEPIYKIVSGGGGKK